jgi:hypothetical protein
MWLEKAWFWLVLNLEESNQPKVFSMFLTFKKTCFLIGIIIDVGHTMKFFSLIYLIKDMNKKVVI